MSPDERLRSILSGPDAPAEDDAFVAMVMAQATAPAQGRPHALPALLRPFALIACLVALGAVAPMLAQGVNAALGASDPNVLFGSLALALTAWLVLNAFSRSFRPVLAR